MKSCNEMVNSLLKRKEQYETERNNKRRTVKHVLTPICCMCLVAILGITAASLE